MGLLDGTTQREYYQGSDLGNYQFTSVPTGVYSIKLEDGVKII